MIRIVILLLTLSSCLIDLNLASPILLSKPNLTASDCTYFSFNFWFPILAVSTFLGFVWGFYRHISPFHGIYNIFCCCCRHCYCSDDSEKNEDNKRDESEAEVENLTDQNQKIIYPEEFLDTLSKLSDVSQILKSLSKICSIIIIYYHFLLRILLPTYLCLSILGLCA